MSGVTFVVSDTKPTQTPEVLNYEDHLNNLRVVRRNKGTVLVATQPKNPVETYFNNGFVSAAFLAYSYHHHLVLRPDDVWTAIVMTFGNYVDKHAEEMRKHFVDHDGKRDITIHVEGGDIKTVDWMAIINTFAVEVGKQTKSSVREWIEPDFSTTTPNDRLIGQVALMGAMKNYFSFECMICCGLPGVTLKGTLEDWQKVRVRLDKLLEYAQPDLVTWHTMLAPILDQFVASYQGQVETNKNFWSSICHYIPGSSGPSFISGWINAFVPFDRDGCWALQGSKEYPYGKIDTGKVPLSAIEVPVKVDDYGREYDTLLYAGAIVNCYDKETNQLSPSLDFALIDVTSSGQAKPAAADDYEDYDDM